MIDKGLYRTNFRGGGADLGAGASGMGSGRSAPGPGDTGGAGGYGRDTNQRGNIGSSPTSTGGGRDNRFTEFTKDVLNPNIDFVGNTVFGPTQKYSGSGFLSGYRNINPITGQPLTGISYLADRLKSFASNLNPFSVIGGIIAGPFGSILGQGINKLGALKDYDTLADYAKGEFNMFQDEDEDDIETQDIRDKYNRLGITSPNLITPTNLNDYLGYRNREYVENAPAVNNGILDVIDYTDPYQGGMYN